MEFTILLTRHDLSDIIPHSRVQTNRRPVFHGFTNHSISNFFPVFTSEKRSQTKYDGVPGENRLKRGYFVATWRPNFVDVGVESYLTWVAVMIDRHDDDYDGASEILGGIPSYGEGKRMYHK